MKIRPFLDVLSWWFLIMSLDWLGMEMETNHLPWFNPLHPGLKSCYAPDHKMSVALCHGLCIGVHKHLVSINYRTNALVDWSYFSVAYWEWLEEGSFRWSAPPLIQDGHHLGFGFRRLEGKRLGRLIQFLCGLLGVTRWRFLLDDQLHRSSKMAATAANLDLVSVDFLTVDWSIFCHTLHSPCLHLLFCPFLGKPSSYIFKKKAFYYY
jgi:hypothetical protein